MSTTTMHFGPEWMRTKHQPLARSQPPPSPPPTNVLPSAGLSTYSALVSATPPVPSESTDEAHPFRYSKEELLKIYQEGGGKGGLGLEVERWNGVVREAGAEPVTLREMTDAEKKLFASSLNSEIRRRPSQSTEFLSPLTTSSLDRPRLPHNASSTTTNSPLRERFGGLKRRDSAAGTSESTVPSVLRKPSLSTLQTPTLSPREPPRPRVGYTPSFDGVLNSGESWMARRRTSETPTKPGGGPLQKEDTPRAHLNSHMTEDSNTTSSSPSQIHADEHRLYAAAAATGTGSTANPSSAVPVPANETVNLDRLGSDFKGIGPPPGLIDLAAVEWSYKDPTGQIRSESVTGPFRADLMQKWYNDGYFSSDLPMKRLRYDTQWTTVAELIQRTNGEYIFLSHPTTHTPPNPANGSPQTRPSSGHGVHEPFQPAPIRSLRPSTLESYVSTGSLTSESPSSSVGASHFGNPSPDPSAFGGRDSQSYLGNDFNGRISTFGAQERPIAFTDRRTLDFQTHPINNMRGPSFGGFVSDRDLGFNAYPYNGVPIPHDSWGMSPNMPSPAFVGTRDQEGDRSFSLSNPLPTELGSTHRQPEVTGGESLSRAYDHNSIFSNEDLGNLRHKRTTHDLNALNYNHYDFAGPASFQNIQDQPTQYASPVREYVNGPSNLYSFGQNIESLPESSPLPSIPTVPWSSISGSSPSHRLRGQAEAMQSITTTSAPSSSLPSQSPWHHINEAGAQIAPNEQDAPNVPANQSRQLNQQHESSSETVVQKIDGPGQAHPSKATKALQANHQVTQPIAEELIVTPVVQKTAWVKEEEGKKKAGANVSKLEARKAVEREKERIARLSTSAETKEDIQPFTASWGLPTSQAGVRVNAGPSPPAVPKTMKEIQEEEEVQSSPAVAPKRAYAETTTKVAAVPPLSSINPWTTVGPNGKSNAAVPAQVRSPAQSSTSFTQSVSRATVSPAQKPIANVVVKPKPPPKQDETLESPSHDFLKWLSDSLKGLNTSVNVEEIVSMLLSFPLDPDASTTEIISDTIYSNSTTLDGRRFASEFVAKRKADATARKGASLSGKAPLKPISIADVVKATPKTPQPEWGFKVVNKKKKGGRS
ncbi:hypothetical protein CPB84DRAFT_1759918 [Gymnopilus junonius]|uniref:GYF domain-containing protein n=1 Tax=Gymnopilus junonius TaxID=109634 RepID=A0A9P5P1S7_GYMJU|nr:hypothetical protein CPB84DRAFT_1759918 [Gymnopilus junonius]